MPDKLVVIARFSDYIKAEMAKQLLDDAGIESVVTGQNASSMYAGVPAIEGPELQVLECQAQKAQEILDSNAKQDG